jgi:hypothetical protein
VPDCGLRNESVKEVFHTMHIDVDYCKIYANAPAGAAICDLRVLPYRLSGIAGGSAVKTGSARES